MSKTCPKCKLTLPEEEFNWKFKNIKRSVYCRICSQSFIRKHYTNNVQYYLNKAKKRNKVVKEIIYDFLAQYLSSHPCIDCGEKDILVLEFDHQNRNEKIGEISSIIRNTISLQRVIEEVTKCDIRCANCHRRKTERENNSWRLKYAPIA